VTQTGDLETEIMNLLQLKKHGETVAELSQHLKRPEGTILTVLYALQKGNFVSRSDTGVWTMVRIT
jgi:DNA-binding IclR family transcriptional regulator